LVVKDIQELDETIKEIQMRIAIVTVPGSHAQAVIDRIVSCGIRAILNYAPVGAPVPTYVKLRNVDPIFALQSMSYYFKD
jgi:redox-sensing transcriptional repressor